ncbi:hypothetical protein SOPP22_05305 [Shewanella sp. OPT22]|nr:hypothetical protein SOPP22_05305 [Shewanella sp. OPT22]
MSIKSGGLTDSLRQFENSSVPMERQKGVARQLEDSGAHLSGSEEVSALSQEYTFGHQIEKPSDDVQDQNFELWHDVIMELVKTGRSYGLFWNNGQQLLADSSSDFNNSEINAEQHRNFFALLKDPKVSKEAKKMGIRVMARKSVEGCKEPNARAELFRHATLAIKFSNHRLSKHWKACVTCAVKDVIADYQCKHPIEPKLSPKELDFAEKELLAQFGICYESTDGLKPKRMEWVNGLKLEADLKISPELILEYATGEQESKDIKKGYIAKTLSVIDDADFEVFEIDSDSKSLDNSSSGSSSPNFMRSPTGAIETDERGFENSFDSQSTASVSMVDEAWKLRMNSPRSLRDIPAMSLQGLSELRRAGETQYTEQSTSFNDPFADDTGSIAHSTSHQNSLSHQELFKRPSPSESSHRAPSENGYSSDEESLLDDASGLVQSDAISQSSLPSDGGSIGGIADLDDEIYTHRREAKTIQLGDNTSVSNYSLSERSVAESLASYSSVALAESIEKKGNATRLGKLFLATSSEPEMKSVRVPKGETYTLISSNGLSYHLLSDKKEQVELSMKKHSGLPLTNMPVKAAFIVGIQVIQSATTPEELQTYYRNQILKAELSPALKKCLESEIQAKCAELAREYPAASGKYDSLELLQKRVSKVQSLNVVLGELISEAGFKKQLKEFQQIPSLNKESAEVQTENKRLTRQRMEKMTSFAKDNYFALELSEPESADRSQKLEQLAKHWIVSEVVDYPEVRKYILETEEPGPTRTELLSMFERAEGKRVKAKLDVANRGPGFDLKATLLAELAEDGSCCRLTPVTLHENGIWKFIDENLKGLSFSSFTTEELEIINNAYSSRVPTEEHVRDILPRMKEQLALRKPLEQFDELSQIPGLKRNPAGATDVKSVTSSIGLDNATKLHNLVEKYLFDTPEIEVAERKVAETMQIKIVDPEGSSPDELTGRPKRGIEELEKQAADLVRERKKAIEAKNERDFQYQQLENARKMEIREELVVGKMQELLREGRVSFDEAKKVADDKEDSKFLELLNKAQDRIQYDRFNEGEIGYTQARPTVMTPDNLGVVMALDKTKAAGVKQDLIKIHDLEGDSEAFSGILSILDNEGFFSKLPHQVKMGEGIWQRIDHELLKRDTNKMTTPQLHNIIDSYRIQRDIDDPDDPNARKVIERLENSIRYRANRKVESKEARSALVKIDSLLDIDEKKVNGISKFLSMTDGLYGSKAPKMSPQDTQKIHDYALDMLHSPEPEIHRKFRVRAKDRLPANEKYLKRVEQEKSKEHKKYVLRTSETTGESYVVRNNEAELREEIIDRTTKNPLRVVLCYKAIPESKVLRVEAARRLLTLNAASCAPELFADPNVFEALSPTERANYSSVMLDVLYREAVKTNNDIAINYVESKRRDQIDPQAQFERKSVIHDLPRRL